MSIRDLTYNCHLQVLTCTLNVYQGPHIQLSPTSTDMYTKCLPRTSHTIVTYKYWHVHWMSTKDLTYNCHLQVLTCTLNVYQGPHIQLSPTSTDMYTKCLPGTSHTIVIYIKSMNLLYAHTDILPMYDDDDLRYIIIQIAMACLKHPPWTTCRRQVRQLRFS